MPGSFINVIGGMSNTSLIFGRDATPFLSFDRDENDVERLIAQEISASELRLRSHSEPRDFAAAAQQPECQAAARGEPKAVD
jgi:hypothetical protein